MYPFVRQLKEILVARRAPPIRPTAPHVSAHLCWPWDLDFMFELNNGRTLMLYDLGRMPMMIRTGLWAAIRSRGWGVTIAGNSVRYRRRVRVFDRIEMHSRCVGWDRRFLYMDQSMWVRGECTSQVLIRAAFTDSAGIVAPARVIEALGISGESPPLPGWIAAWIAADAERPWPPERN